MQKNYQTVANNEKLYTNLVREQKALHLVLKHRLLEIGYLLIKAMCSGVIISLYLFTSDYFCLY